MREKVAARHILRPLWLTLVALLFGSLSLAVHANCTIGATSATCDNTSPNPFTKPIGDGTQNNYTITVNGGTSTSNAAQISVHNNKEPIHINDGGTINIGNFASVTGTANAGGSPAGKGFNMIDFNNNSMVTVGVGATVLSNGTAPTAEAINARGTGNTIINNGLIEGDPASAIFFQSGSSTNTVINNATGIIRSTHGAIGGAPGANTIFVNRGLIDGNLVFLGTSDQLTLYTGSQITGSLQGGGGNDSITLAGTGGQSLPGSNQGFATLKKIDPGAWTLTGAITGNLNVDVNQGTLTVTGNNTGFSGSIVVDPAGTLAGLAVSLPPSVTDNGQVLFTQTAPGTYAGLISGTGSVTRSGTGTLALSGNETYRGGTTISAGALQLGNGGTTGSVLGNITDNGTLSFNRSGTTTFPGIISGTGNVSQIGPGTTVLTGANSYTGGTTVNTGMLQLGSGGTAGSIVGNVAVNGNGALVFNRSDINTFPGVISGTGAVMQIGTGTTVLTGADTYTGGTIVSGGILQIGNGGTSGAIVGDVTVNNALVVADRSDAIVYGGTISGNGGIMQLGSGSLTLTGDNAFTGTTTIAAGTLQLGNGVGSAGAVTGNIVDNGALVVDHAGNITYGGVISGSGTATKIGSSTITLTGANTFTGLGTVAGGRLNVDGSTAGNVQVNANATLGGRGSIAGAVTIANNGHLSPGDSPGTLTVGSLVLNSSSQLDYQFGQPNIVGGTTNDLTSVTGNLTLAGQLNISDLGGFGSGVYRVFNYGGALTDNGLAFGTLPTGFTSSDILVQTSVPNQVNLLVSSGGFALQFWDGSQLTASGTVVGGTSTWDTSTRWTDTSGSVNAPWQSGFAVFEGTAGTVTLAGNVNFSGMEFLTDGYAIQGNGFTLAASPATVIRVEPGVTATVNVSIVDGTGGAASVTKRDGGVLILSGANTYTGGTAVDGGTLQVASDGNLGASTGALSLDGGTLATTASFTSGRVVTLNTNGGAFAPVAGTTLTLPNVISGTGTLTKTDAGTLLLGGTNTYGGGTVLNGGILGVSSDANLGAASGLLDFTGGTLQFESSFNPATTRAVTIGPPGGSIDTNGNNVTFAQVINGTGTLTKLGNGTLILAADDINGGGATIAAGTLQLGNGGSAGSLQGNVLDNGTLAFNRSDTLTYPGIISGSGSLVQLGAGTTVLTGSDTYSGGTTISGGTLQISDGGTSGSVTGNIINNGVLVFNHSDDITFGGAISGTGTLAQNGDGTLFITGSVTDAGATTINEGTLSIGNGTVDGTVATDIVDNSALVFNRSGTSYGNVISGPGTVQKLGAGTLILTGSNTYSGVTTISAGTLQVGNGSTAGTLGTGDVVNNAALVFDRSDTVGYGGSVSGTGSVTQAGSGTLVLTGNSTYTGATSVNAGVLLVNGSLGSTAVTVASGTTLGGAGIIAGPVTVNGGTVAPGAQLGQAGTLYVGGLTLHSQLDFALAMPNVIGNPNALLNDTGDLSLSGVLNVSDTGQFASTPGSYRLINYEGVLSGAGLTLGSIPGGANEAVIQTTVPNEVNLIKYINGLPVQFWDGVPTNEGDSLIDGGNGNWNNSLGNWTNVTGTINQSWIVGMGIFTGATGTVPLGEPVTAMALQFLSDGYRISGNGNVLTMISPPGGAMPLVRVDPGVTATIDAVVAGTNGLEKGDPGTLVLSQNNTYTGGTTISNGILQLGEGGTSGSIIGDVANSGTLAFNRSDVSTFAGIISGVGSVRQIGPGTTNLTGINTYTGGTTIATGMLTGSATSFGSGAILDNAALVIDQPANASFANAIDGRGTFTKSGTGALNLTGTSTLSGPTTVAAGLLSVNGFLGNSAVTVQNSAILGGNGTVGQTAILQGGTIAPGNSIGTITVNGAFTQTAGSAYQVQVNPTSTASDLIRVNGAATLARGAILDVIKIAPGEYSLNSHYTVLTAVDGVTGTYTLTGDITGAFFNLVGVYDANNVYLNPVQVRNFVAAAQTPNEIATAGGLQSLPDGNPVKDAVGLLPTDDAARAAFNQLSGEIHASVKTALAGDSRYIRDTAVDRLLQSFCLPGADKRIATARLTDSRATTHDECTTHPAEPVVWARVFGAWGNIHGDGNAASLRETLGGFLVGADTTIAQQWRVGALAGYTGGNFNVDDRKSSASSDNYHVGLYGGRQWGNLGVRAGAAYTWHSINTNRSTAFAGFTDNLKGDYSARTVQVFGDIGYQIAVQQVVLEPFASIAYVNLHTSSFNEQGGPAALSGDSGNTDSTFSTLGLRGSTNFALGNGTVVTVSGALGWQHAFGSVVPLSTVAFAGGSAFTVAGLPLARNAAIVEAGLDFQVTPRASLGVTYSGQFGSGTTSQSVQGIVKVRF